jgi:5'-nucleotidase
MPDDGLELSGARILVTNDDGVRAPGLKVLIRIARALSKDVWVVAPEHEQSATSHSLTLRRPLRARRMGPRRFAVDGTPTDCVLVALHRLIDDKPADLVLSGVNHGANLGEDVTYSGTIAAAMEGALLGVRSIALSQMRDSNGVIHWSTPERYAPEIIRKLVALPWPADVLVNVNFPPCTPDGVNGIRGCRQGRRDNAIQVVEGRDPVGRDYLWLGDFLSDSGSGPDTDLGAIVDGAIAVTPLHLDLTHGAMLERFEGLFR